MSPGDDDRQRLEMVTEELLNLYEEMNVLYSVSEIAARSADIAGAGARILEEAVALLKADVGLIVYASADLRAEEPEPTGLPREACRRLAEIVALRIDAAAGSIVIAPFVEGASVPRAPEAIVAASLAVEKESLGILCLGRRGRGASFTSGDQKILSVLATQTALVIEQRRNLDLSRAAKSLAERAEALRGIAEVGREVASTLDAPRILRALADLPARLLGFDRCGVLVDERGALRIEAISAAARVDREDPSVASLEALLVWAAGRGRSLIAVDRGGAGGVAAEDLSAPGDVSVAGPFGERAALHFERSSFGAILVIPLADEQGSLGAIGFEAASAGILTEASREAATIVALQATVALRNARLYRDLPFVSLLEPMRRSRARFEALSGRRLAAWGAGASAVMLGATLISWDLRIPGSFVLQPARRVDVVAHVRGVVKDVSDVPDGALVRAGEVLARLDDTDGRLRLGEADGKVRAAELAVVRSEAEGRAADLAGARLDRARWERERELLRSKVDQTVLRAPLDGVLMTPHLRERAGELLDVGSVLCTLAPVEPMRAEIAVPERDADVLLAESLPLPAVLKFESFPERDVAASVHAVRHAAEIVDGRTSIIAEAQLEGAMP
ncbi:MAG TPA: GAF domain-containing protein, partial [Verrucomicrobiae bacterium]|nr:GAF domain-containing protein [Verrucomicrobiae bacterium]